KEEITIGLKVNDLEIGEHFDIVWTIAGKEINKHAQVSVVRLIHSTYGNAESKTAAEGHHLETLSYNIWITNFTKVSTSTATRGLIMFGNGTLIASTTSLSGNTFI